MLSALSEAGAEFLVVGAHALAAHGHPRATGDLDIWVSPTEQNAARVWAALLEFGAPLTELQRDDLVTPGVVFQIGVAPRRVDILTSVTGLRFQEAWEGRAEVELAGMIIPVLSRDDLITNKRAVGRLRDLADIEDLEGTSGEAPI